MKQYSFLFFLVLLMNACQDINPHDALYPAKKGAYFGYINKNGRWIISPKWRQATPFFSDFGLVGGKYLIDNQGRVYKFSWRRISIYTGMNDFAHKGKYVTSKDFMHTYKPDIPKRTADFLSKRTNLLIPFCEKYMHSFKASYGYINVMGDIIIPAKFAHALPFHEGLAAVAISISKKRDCLFGYINHKGIYVYKPQYRSAGSFSEGLAYIQDAQTGMYGYIDKKNNITIKPSFLRAYKFSSGIARVISGGTIVKKINTEFSDVKFITKGGQAKYIDKNGRYLFERVFYYAQDFSEGLAGVMIKINGKLEYCYIGTNGAIKIRGNFSGISPFRNGLAQVSIKNGKMAYINKNGKIVWEEK